MPDRHPPWLRFQAYVVGLPKTGSTSVCTVFGNYRTSHEWDLQGLLAAGLLRRSGLIDDDEFWRQVTPRLTQPGLEMDSATSHFLYVRPLSERFPNAVFVHTVRDVRGWVTSALDMFMRKRMARSMMEVSYTETESMYLDFLSEGTLAVDTPADKADDVAIAPMMRTWARHMTETLAALPRERSLVLRTDRIGDQLADLARLCGVPADSMRADLAHSNKATVRCDRMAVFDSAEIRRVYDEFCAEHMARWFPDTHASMWDVPRVQDPAQAWAEHVMATREYVREAITVSGMAAAR